MRFPKFGIIKRRKSRADLFLPELLRDVPVGVRNSTNVRMPKLTSNYFDWHSLTNEVTGICVTKAVKNEIRRKTCFPDRAPE